MSSSYATVLFSQAPQADAEGGAFSTPTQTLADNFNPVLSGAYNRVSFWGSFYEQGDPMNIGDTSEFRIRLYDTPGNLPGNMLDDQTVTASVGEETMTEVMSGATVYRFDVDVSAVSVSSGTNYFLSVITTNGATNWRWHNGVGTGSVSAFTTGSGWNSLGGVRSNMAFELSSEPVPEPSTLVAAGLGLAAMLRRKRKQG